MPDNPSSALVDFREFLKHKANESGARDRHHRRREWLDSVRGFMEQVRGWLDQADPEQVLDIQPYIVSRTEAPIGTYDAPALRISLGVGEVDILPIGRYVSARTWPKTSAVTVDLAGRIDLKGDSGTFRCYREVLDDDQRWEIWDEEGRTQRFEEESFIRTIQGLLS